MPLPGVVEPDLVKTTHATAAAIVSLPPHRPITLPPGLELHRPGLSPITV
jgi:hypothetical protein